MKNSLDFSREPFKDLETLLDKMVLPSVYQMIMKLLITKGNPTLMPKGDTDEKLNDLSRKKMPPLTLLQEGENRMWSSK